MDFHARLRQAWKSIFNYCYTIRVTEKPAIKAIIFDLGGVILRTLDAGPREALARRYGLSYAALDQIVFHCPAAQAAEHGQASEAQVWQEVGRLLNAPAADIDEVAKQFFAGDRIDWELVQFIRGLRPAYTTALLSNTWLPDLAGWLVQHWQLPADTFDVVVASAQCGLAKPDPAIFTLALAQVHAAPAEAIFVDDFIKNVEAAQALGIHAIHYRRTAETIETILHYLGREI